jgi:hypothetical protein
MPFARLSDAYEVMSAQDLIEVAKAAAMLPGGGWTVDPVADIRQPGRPCVWLHPATSNPISMSFGTSKRNGLFWITVRHHGNDEPISYAGTPYASIGTAFASFGETLLMLRPNLVGI